MLLALGEIWRSMPDSPTHTDGRPPRLKRPHIAFLMRKRSRATRRNDSVTRWIRDAGQGHCGATTTEGDCLLGAQGSFGWSLHARDLASAVTWCGAQCRVCAQCKYITISTAYKDCSWYRSCDLGSLHKPPNNSPWKSFRSGPAPNMTGVLNVTKLTHWGHADSRAARERLRACTVYRQGRCEQAATGYVGELPWVRPRAQVSVAACLFGKVGSLTTAAGYMQGDKHSSPALVREGHASLVRYVLAPNPRATVDFFSHSWNPSLGTYINALYRPVLSKHEKDRMVEFMDVAKSALFSIRAALRMKMAHEKKRGRRYDLAMLLRYDLAFYQCAPPRRPRHARDDSADATAVAQAVQVGVARARAAMGRRAVLWLAAVAHRRDDRARIDARGQGESGARVPRRGRRA